jgi:hypothetical protein
MLLLVVSGAVWAPGPALAADPDLATDGLDVEPFQLQPEAPIKTWDEALPLGNGLTGGLLWGSGNTINLSLDRGDLWDERLPEIYHLDNWTMELRRDDEP